MGSFFLCPPISRQVILLNCYFCHEKWRIMLDNLNQPYPFNNNFKHNVRSIGLVTMGFVLIVLYFQPFGINFLSSYRHGYFVLGVGIVSAFLLFVNSLILPGLFPRIFKTRFWTIKREILWNVWVFVLIFLSFIFTAWACKISDVLVLPILRTGALALLPMVLHNLINYNRQLKDRVVTVIDSGLHWLGEEHKKRSADKSRKVVLKLKAENGKDSFEVDPNEIIVINSASNYVEIFWRDEAKIQKRLLRVTLSQVEKQLKSYAEFRKCHRCWVVNLKQVTRLARTPQGYVLHSNGLQFGIPVSRSYVSSFRQIFS